MRVRHVVMQTHLGPRYIEGDAVIHDVLSPLNDRWFAAARTTEQAHACQLPKSPELAGCAPDLDDLLIHQRAALGSASAPLRTGFFGRAIAGKHVVLNVTFADTPFEECVGVLAQVFGCAALTGLGDLVHRRHDLPSRQHADCEIEMILETALQRRHRRLPVHDLASSQGCLIEALFTDRGQQRSALHLGHLLALGVVRIAPMTPHQRRWWQPSEPPAH